MIPLGDSIRSRRTPWVTYALLILNVGIYMSTAILGLVDTNDIVYTYGLIPFRVMRSFDLEAAADLLTSMFLHGSLLHLGSNMLYLWIFGDNVEDAFGPVGYSTGWFAGQCRPHPGESSVNSPDNRRKWGDCRGVGVLSDSLPCQPGANPHPPGVFRPHCPFAHVCCTGPLVCDSIVPGLLLCGRRIGRGGRGCLGACGWIYNRRNSGPPDHIPGMQKSLGFPLKLATRKA